MLCIEVSRNGERLAAAGLPGKGVVSVVFNRVLSDANGVLERRDFRMGGLDVSVEPNRSLHWTGGKVEVGDEFIVRFIEKDVADAPLHAELSSRPSESELRRFRRRQLKNLEAELLRVRKLLEGGARGALRKGTARVKSSPGRTAPKRKR